MSNENTLEYRGAVWIEPDMIDCEINLRGRWLPFTASAGDSEEHGRALFAVLAAQLGPYIAPEIITTSEGP